MKCRVMYPVVLFLFLTTFVAGIGVAEEPVTIVFYHRGYTTEAEWARAVIEQFEALHPHIRVESLSSGSGGGREFSEKLTVYIAGGNAPDVFYGSTDKLGFILNGWTKDLTDWVERDADELRLNDFFPRVMDSFVRDDRVYGIPLTVTPQLIFYNKDMFAEAGVTNPPADWNDVDWNWERFEETSRKLTVSNPDGTYNQLALSTVVDKQLPDIAWMFGGDWFDAATYETGYPSQVTMVTDENILAYETLADYYSRYAADGVFKGISVYEGFGQGLLAMDWIGAYKLDKYIQTQRAGAMKFDWGMAAVPIVENRQNTRWTDPLYISSATEHPEEAWEFVKFATGPEGQRLWAELTGKIPSRQSGLSSFVESVSHIVGLNPAEVTLAIGGALDHGRTSLEEIIPELPLIINNNQTEWFVPMLSGQQPVRSGLSEIERALNAIIAERGWNG